MRSVALVGFASRTRNGVFKSRADEVWTLNMALSSPLINKLLPMERVTRLFELHYPAVIKHPSYSPSSGPLGQWKWLTENEHEFPIYMLEAYPEVHNVVRYPIEEIHQEFGYYLLKDHPEGYADEQDYITSSMGFMMALAIMEDYDLIELYGIEMQQGSEYFWQKPSGLYWMGVANGRGIKVLLHQNSRLITPFLYGYESAEMITQAQIEAHIIQYSGMQKKMIAELNSNNATLVERQGDGKDVEELRTEINGKMRHLIGIDYVLQFLNKLKDQSQLEEFEPTLVNRFQWRGIKTPGISDEN